MRGEGCEGRVCVLIAPRTSGIESKAGWAGVCAFGSEDSWPLMPFVVPLRPWVPFVSPAIAEWSLLDDVCKAFCLLSRFRPFICRMVCGSPVSN